ncbi:MAG: helix-turn-helix domain-containing protein [Nanoarchaeota archaeon]
MQQILERIGLTGNEAKLYLALLELGSVPAGPLIKKAGMHRAAVYDLLDLLIDKGLVSYVVKANRKYFEAAHPSRLLEYVDTKKQMLDEKRKALETVLPQLEMKRKLSKEPQEGTIYKGKKGLKSIFEAVLNENKPWHVFGATGQFKELFPAYYIHFHRRRAKKKIPLNIIFNENLRKEQREKELDMCTLKYLPESYITPSTTYVYGDKVAIILWSTEPMAFLMRSQQVADSYRGFFSILWNVAKK